MNSIYLGGAFQLIPIHVITPTPWRWPSCWRNPKAKFVLGQENLTGKRDVRDLQVRGQEKLPRKFLAQQKTPVKTTGAMGRCCHLTWKALCVFDSDRSLI
jgi:hypothetical protein